MPDVCLVANDCNRGCSCHEEMNRGSHHNMYYGESSFEDVSCQRCEEPAPRFRVMAKRDIQESLLSGNECVCCKKPQEKPAMVGGCEIPPDSDSEEEQLAVVREDVESVCDEEGGFWLGMYIKGLMFIIAFSILGYAMHRFSQTYSKSHEILSVMFLLLLTLLIFEPKYFIPYMIFNNIMC